MSRTDTLYLTSPSPFTFPFPRKRLSIIKLTRLPGICGTREARIVATDCIQNVNIYFIKTIEDQLY
jgi:hypothetical protein